MKNFSFKKNGGYTVIETMVAVAVFTIIVSTGTASLLRANMLHNKSADMRSLVDNLSFVMEEMSRNIRTGFNYRCVTNGVYNTNQETPQSCATGAGIIFEHSFGDAGDVNDQWAYKVESTNGGVSYNISKSTDGGANWVQLNASDVALSAVSGFSVLGAPPPAGDTQQPLVSIRLVGSITYNGVVSPFSLQTNVSQRLVDLP